MTFQPSNRHHYDNLPFKNVPVPFSCLRATLGHKTLNMTLHYAGIDLRRAAEVAAAMG